LAKKSGRENGKKKTGLPFEIGRENREIGMLGSRPSSKKQKEIGRQKKMKKKARLFQVAGNRGVSRRTKKKTP